MKTNEQILEKLQKRHRMYRRDIATMKRCLKEWEAKLANIEKHMKELEAGE